MRGECQTEHRMSNKPMLAVGAESESKNVEGRKNLLTGGPSYELTTLLHRQIRQHRASNGIPIDLAQITRRRGTLATASACFFASTLASCESRSIFPLIDFFTLPRLQGVRRRAVQAPRQTGAGVVKLDLAVDAKLRHRGDDGAPEAAPLRR